MTDTSEVIIYKWMVATLRLKGTELILFAMIYDASTSGEHKFTGSLQYMADCTNTTKAGVQRALKALITKGYIEKHDVYRNKVKFCEYRVSKTLTG